MNNRRQCLYAALLLFLSPAAYGQVNVFACEPEWASLAGELGGDLVTTYSATTGRQDVHHIQARPGLIARARKADLLLCTGAGLEEGWLPVLLARANNPHIRPGAPGYLETSAAVSLLEVQANADRSAGHVHPLGNPHIQLDPRNIPAIATAVSRRLGEIDPQNAGSYDRRLEDFLDRWRNAMARWEAGAADLKGMRVVVHHNAWVYLVRWLGLEQSGTLEEKPGIPPTSGHLSRLLDRLEEQPVSVIIRSPYQSARPSRWLSERSGIRAIELPSTVGGTDGATDLFSLFDDILERLLAAQS